MPGSRPADPWYLGLEPSELVRAKKTSSIELRRERRPIPRAHIGSQLALLAVGALPWMTGEPWSASVGVLLLGVLTLTLGMMHWMDYVVRQRTAHRRLRRSLEIPFDASTDAHVCVSGMMRIDGRPVPVAAARDVVVVHPIFWDERERFIGETEALSIPKRRQVSPPAPMPDGMTLPSRFCTTLVTHDAAYELESTSDVRNAIAVARSLKRGLEIPGAPAVVATKVFSSRGRMIAPAAYVLVMAAAVVSVPIFAMLASPPPWLFFANTALLLAVHNVSLVGLGCLLERDAKQTGRHVLELLARAAPVRR